ncbi:pentatricopeptide repeat-containing protein At4g14170-like [Mercurialis annua]|uniref:pentatricopeptide repeat-containing protein At4g14170-like n=1 Tax=Mercurialis annua TaxID=3986 RepID=UPI00215F9907|nr:pentatricopeptide repeat-containing protein At4g14170-like [Mercurialis annua]
MLPFCRKHSIKHLCHNLISAISLNPIFFQHFFSLSTTAAAAAARPIKTHVNLLSLTSTLKSLTQTKQAHALALLNGFLPPSISLCAALILRYATFHRPSASHLLFQQTLPFVHSPFLFNTLIRAFSIAKVDDHFQTYNEMVRIGVRPDDYTFPFVLKACADYLSVRKGLEIHGCVFKLGFDFDVYVGNTLLLFYGNSEFLWEAKKVFDEMPERDMVSWNTILGVFSVSGFYVEAINLFSEMNTSGFRPNMVSVVSVLPVCAELADEMMARQVHCYILKAGFDFQVTVRNALVDVYGKCGNVKSSRQVFDEMTERNEVSWNAIITSLAYLGQYKVAFEIFRWMINEGVTPNTVTISSMLPVLVGLEHFHFGKEIHAFSLRFGIESDVFISNSLIDMYAKSGHSSKASNVFHLMARKNVVSWNAMVANFAQNKLELAAIELVRQMQVDAAVPNSVTFTNALPACARMGFIRPGKEIHARSIRIGCWYDLFVSNALTDMYAKCGCLNLAHNVFNVSLKDEVSYNILIVGYSQTTWCSESLSLFLEMSIVGLKHDVVSYMGVIAACASLAALKQGKEIHVLAIRKQLHMHIFIANSLLDFYTKCGRIDLAHKIFDRISNKDAASWNTIILGYGMLGELEIAIDLFEAMKEEGVEYDSVSYIAVLSACSHGGLVEKGIKYFKEMQTQKINATQMHYACMVDLLGRAGLMEAAEELIKGSPIEPDSNVWGAMLGACRIYGNIELGCWAAERLFELKPRHSGYYSVLSNIYAEAGQWDEAKRVRKLMSSKGAKKNPGCSYVQIDDQVHAFVAGDKIDKFDPGVWDAEL